MKKLIYLSGILGGILLLFSIIGIITEFNYNDYLLAAGAFLIVIVFIPLSILLIEFSIKERLIKLLNLIKKQQKIKKKYQK